MTIAKTFERLARDQELAMIPYITAGFPSFDRSIELVRRFADAGADVIEVGVPFSDPVADGPTIQFSSQRALENGVSLRRILGGLCGLSVQCPLVLMSYLNPLLAVGSETLFEMMKAAGISGVIVPDLPVEEADDFGRAAAGQGIDLILMAAPTTPAARLATLCRKTSGFLYCVGLKGTTGARRDLSADVEPLLLRGREVTNKPLVVGFGISRPQHVRRLYGKVDGVVVGSRLIDAIRQSEDPVQIVRELKEATRSTAHAGRHAS